MSEGDTSTDILVAGAGVGGVAAAIACLEVGRRVVQTDPSDWPGGQLTAQVAPPHEPTMDGSELLIDC